MRHLSSLSIAIAFALPLLAQRHPHFDDKGALDWHRNLAAAKAAAREQQKFVFVEYGRQA